MGSTCRFIFLLTNKLGFNFLQRLKMFEVRSKDFFYNTMLESLIRYGIAVGVAYLQ